MAILKDIEVTVTVDDVALREWDDPDRRTQTDTMISKYIEARAGDRFTIEISIPEHTAVQGECEGFRGDVYVDGIAVDHPLFRGDKLPSTQKTSGAISRRDGQSVISNLYFSHVRKSFGVELPGGIIEEYQTKFQSVGCIEVKLFRCSKIWPSTGRSDFDKGGGLELRDAVVPAKAFVRKANFLRSELSPAEAIEVNWWYNTSIESVDAPWLRFCFLYRSREALQVLGFVPRSPSPPPFTDQDIDGMDRDQAIRMLKALQERERLIEMYNIFDASRVSVKHEKIKSEFGRLQADTNGATGSSQHKRRRSGDDSGLEIVGSTTQSKRRRLDVENATDIIELD